MSQEAEWVFIGLDEKMARRQGMPLRLPIPKAELEGLAEKGLQIDVLRKWIKTFLEESELGKSGQWRKASSQLVSSLETFLDKAPLFERASAAFAENDHDKAISALKRITAMDPEDHSARLNLASAYANKGDMPLALKAFNAVRKTFEGDADYHVGVGHVHARMGDTEAAINEMVLALEAKPDCQPALDALEKLGVLVGIYENPRDAASLIYIRADAVLSYLTGQWDAEPRDAAFFLEQLAYHERESRHAVALAAAERAISAAGGAVGPERAELARISALRELGRREEALAAARAFASKAPGSAGALVELSRCLAAAGKQDEARAALDEALALDPGDQLALVLRFWPANRNDLQQMAAALPALAAFAESHPGVAGVWRSVARAKLAIGNEDEALELFAKAVSLAPADDDLRAEYWSELGKKQRYADILEDAKQVTGIGKRDWKLRWNEAEAYAGLRRRIEARTAFSAINYDESLHVDIRKRARRAVKAIDEGNSATD